MDAKSSDKDGATNVWRCICAYQTSSASELLSAFGNEHSIIQTLIVYPGRFLYHGHRSGGSGGSEHSGAMDRIREAVTFLRERKPIISTEKSVKSGPNLQLKNKSLMHTNDLMNLIDSISNLGDLRQALDQADSKWKDNKSVWSKFCIAYRAKKGHDPTK